jgi:hypothetical protein
MSAVEGKADTACPGINSPDLLVSVHGSAFGFGRGLNRQCRLRGCPLIVHGPRHAHCAGRVSVNNSVEPAALSPGRGGRRPRLTTPPVLKVRGRSSDPSASGVVYSFPHAAGKTTLARVATKRPRLSSQSSAAGAFARTGPPRMSAVLPLVGKNGSWISEP